MDPTGLSQTTSAPQTRRLWLWCIPALLLGGLLRFWLLQGWQVGLYYGPDSQTYWAPISHAEKGGRLEISQTRPWLYTHLMRATRLPSVPPARSAVLFQHFLGWLLILPLADILSRLTPRWRWWILPVTILYGCHPQLLFWEHVLIADSLFIGISLLACWAFLRFWLEPRHWPWLAAALALAFFSMAARPVGRAFWLGMGGLLLFLPNTNWRKRLACSGITLLLYLPANKSTKVDQGETLLFTSLFPLLAIEQPPYLDVKKEFAAAVESDRANLWLYISKTQRLRWTWLEADRSQTNVGPAYTRVVRDKAERARFVAQLSRQALLTHPFRYLSMVAMKLYWLCGLNEKSARIDPASFRASQTKFLTNSISKYGQDFPAWLLSAPAAQNPVGIAEAARLSTSDTAAQNRFLFWKNILERCTPLYRLPENSTSLPWPRHALPLALFVLGSVGAFWKGAPTSFRPLLVLGIGYLLLTLLVGRAVERYRLPAEFVFLCGVFLGTDQVLRFVCDLIQKLRTRFRPDVPGA